jgi:hypothetical protein
MPAKTLKIGDEIEYDDETRRRCLQIPISKVVDHKKALRARDDVKQIADQIHGAALAKFPDTGPGSNALDGISSMHSFTRRLARVSGGSLNILVLGGHPLTR